MFHVFTTLHPAAPKTNDHPSAVFCAEASIALWELGIISGIHVLPIIFAYKTLVTS